MGTILRNDIGMIVCGRGQCVRDGLGQTYCSAQPGGFALIQYGQHRYTEGCESPRQEYCQIPRWGWPKWRPLLLTILNVEDCYSKQPSAARQFHTAH